MEKSSSGKFPKSQMDMHFLEMVELARIQMKVRSDRAMSKVLGQHENFISRIKTGVQSVPTAVWDTFDRYAKSNNLVDDEESSPSEIARMSIETVSVVERLANAIAKRDLKEILRQNNPEQVKEGRLLKGGIIKSPKADFENYLAAANEKLTAANEVITLLTSQLADKERTIQILLEQASKK